MKNDKKLATIALASFMGVVILSSGVFAATNSTFESNRQFMKKGSMRAAHTDNKEVMEKRLTTKLDMLVADGTITRDQADKIAAKLKELKSNFVKQKQNSKLESRENMKAAVEKWLSDNGIDIEVEKLLPQRNHLHKGLRS